MCTRYRLEVKDVCHKTCYIGLLLIIAILVAGCGSWVSQEIHLTTKGQALQDLDAARQQGLITENLCRAYLSSAIN